MNKKILIPIMLLSIVLISGCINDNSEKLTLSDSNIKMIKPFWIDDSTTNWPLWCQTYLSGQSSHNETSEWAFETMVNLPSLKEGYYIEYTFIMDNVKYPELCGVMKPNSQGYYNLHTVEGSGNGMMGVNLNPMKDNEMTVCFGINNCNQICKTVILPAKCT
ncbi:MAG: hypothetical protein KJ697_04030 [Nanoarchaeota archaeon]|nr:hypothetical protein [Nanoarchaeota archaeon]